MAGLDKREAGPVRASDDDRNKIAAELRAHCVDGRINFDELERRVEQATSAGTLHELDEVVSDLPTISLPADQAGRPERVRVGPPGIRPFTRRIIVPARIERTRAVALDTIAPGLNSLGYELRSQSAMGLEFERSAKERIVISFEEHSSNETMMVVYGRALRTVRKMFAKLNFG